MIVDFFGSLHPVLVHLPIGILLLGVCFELVSSGKRFGSLRPAIPVIIFWGMLAAVFSCITGLVLGSGGDYEDELVNPHQWAGIALAVLSIVLAILYRVETKNLFRKLTALIVLILIFVTGHLGGTITHGEDFLSFSPGDDTDKPVTMKPIPDIQQAVVYTDIVQPLFQARCYSCHGTRKQKGKLRLDEQEYILKGGEEGKAIVAGKPEESEMIQRLLLPLEDDDHMPPQKKTQLTKEQVSLLKWWVSSGADFHKRVGELDQNAEIKPVLLALQTGTSIKSDEIEMIPPSSVAAADPKIISELGQQGVSVLPVARENNYLTANFINTSSNTDSLLSALLKLKEQLVSLKLDGKLPGNAGIQHIASLSKLRRLQLSNAEVSDETIGKLQNLKELRSLNLVGTAITAKGLAQLSKLEHLKYLYLYRTRISETERDQLKKVFPNATLDFGNYSLPMLEGDTSEIKF